MFTCLQCTKDIKRRKPCLSQIELGIPINLHREGYRSQGKLTSCFGYDSIERKAWQFASTLPADGLMIVLRPGSPDASAPIRHL